MSRSEQHQPFFCNGKEVRERFWELFSLGELNNKEWEALCDGCGQCCLKRRVEGDDVTVYAVACELLDIDSARCGDYANRLQKVPHCHQLTPASLAEHYGWLPETCAYRRLYKNLPLPPWHPLLAGDRSRMKKKGITVSSYALPSGSVARRQKPRHVVARWSIAKRRRMARAASGGRARAQGGSRPARD
jgi:uncharacterized cysteine cluster protein YcgN (CxxCxxCC family)